MNAIAAPEAARLVLDAWQFRHTLCWRSLQRFYLAAVTVAVIPFILTCEQRADLQQVLLLFPVLGGLLALAAVWHYGAEYIRLIPLNQAVTRLLASTGLVEFIRLEGMSRWQQIFFRPRIGWATVILLTTITVVLTVLDFFVVQSLSFTACTEIKS
jgi:hypothetical protein